MRKLYHNAHLHGPLLHGYCMYFRAFTVNRKENWDRPDVGYAGSDLNEEGGTVTTPMFMSVGDADGRITFGAITPVADPSVDLVGNLEIQYLQYTGETDWDNSYSWDGEKWLKDGYLDASDMPIPAGQGMWVNNGAYAPVSFRTSGEVNKKDIEYPMNEEGGTVVGNSYPCSVTFSKLVPIADPSVDLVGNLEIQYLQYTGETDWDNSYSWDGEKWLKDGYLDASDLPVPAGQGMWVNNGAYAPVTLRIVAPEFD